ncbi:hypothetical protein [Aeromonas intestinalis]
MWISKIKKYLNSIDRSFALKVTFVFSVFCICMVFFFAVINGAMQILDLNSIGEVVNTISSLATALTLGFLVYQHNTNASKDYQSIMVSEGKIAVDKMVEQTEIMKSWDFKDMDLLSGTLSRISNHAQDFEIFFDAVKDGALREILIIRWQDMYFNHYITAARTIKLHSIINEAVSSNDTNKTQKLILVRLVIEGAINKFRSNEFNIYESNRLIIDDLENEGVIDITGRIGKQTAFKLYFLSNRKLNKYLQGRHEGMDVKKDYADLCAIVDASIERK